MSEGRSSGKRYTRLAFSLLAAAVLLGIVLWLADFEELSRRLRGADPWMILASLLAYLGTYVARARRFAAIGAKASTPVLISVVTIHGALNRLMPLRTGELSYPMLARKVGAAGLGEGLVQLLLLRIMDLLTVAMLFLLAFSLALLLGVAGLGESSNAFLVAAAVIISICLVVLARLSWMLRFGLGIARKVFSLLGATIREKSRNLIDRADAAVSAVTDLRTGQRLLIILWSFACWSFYFLTFHLILLALQVEMPFLRTVLGSSAAIVGSTVPVSGLGTFGALEGGWTAGFVAVGLSPATAASTALVMSGLTLLFALILAAIGWVFLSFRQDDAVAESDDSRKETVGTEDEDRDELRGAS